MLVCCHVDVLPRLQLKCSRARMWVAAGPGNIWRGQGRQYLVMYERVRIIIAALAGDHGIQLVHHGQQQLQLVSRLL